MMQKIVCRSENPYALVDRSILDDKNLSWGAKGLLVYLLSKRDGLRLQIEEIVKQSSDGATTVKNITEELIDAGYIVKEQEKDDEDKTIKLEYVVYEEPQKQHRRS